MKPKPLSLIRAVTTLGALLLTVPTEAVLTDHGDGTVTETTTNLMWDQCSWGQTWTNDSVTCSGGANLYTWANALAIAVTANSTLHRGYNDWRLPNKNELESLVNRAQSNPAIYTAPAGNPPLFPNTSSYFYWTSTTYAPAPSLAWSVSFSDGGTYADDKTADYNHVRLVRGGQSFDLLDASYVITPTASPAGDGLVMCSPNPVFYGEDSMCIAIPIPGYSFVGWGGDCTGLNCALTTVTAPKQVTANFTRTTYNITTSANPSAGGTVSCVLNPVSYGEDSTCTAMPNTGYSFIEWSGDCTGMNCTLTTVTAPKQVTANFTRTTYNITTSANPSVGGTVSCVLNPVPYGEMSMCIAAPIPGYSFTSWSGDCVSETWICLLADVTAPKQVTANFTRNTYSITITANPVVGGTVSCAPNPVSHGDNSICTVMPNPGYHFVQWSGDCTGKDTCILRDVTTRQGVTANLSGGEDVPALGPWGLGLLAGLLTALGGFQMRRRTDLKHR